MNISTALSLTGSQHEQIKKYLYPGDRLESVAFALCGQRPGDRRHKLMVREIFTPPASAIVSRSAISVSWSTDWLVPLLERATTEGLAVVKMHSHPGGQTSFSELDDETDNCLLPMIRGWTESRSPVGSVIMLPDGCMFGRVLATGGSLDSLSTISVAGDDIKFWYPRLGAVDSRDFCASHAQLFGAGTTEMLGRLSVAVVGCSGTGSPMIEQLARLGVGELVLVDYDHIEARNINRIYNSTMKDALEGRAKVDVLKEAIDKIGLGTTVIPIRNSIWSTEVIHAIAQCDIVVGCMDSIDGRYLLNTLATYYSIPYFDIGVRLIAAQDVAQPGKIREVCGSVHYLQPGRSSLMSRGVFNMVDVAAAGLARNDPAAYAEQINDGYISGGNEQRPAVISVNSFAASLAVNEILGRVHPFREEKNEAYAKVEFSLSSMELFLECEEAPCDILRNRVGFGDVHPPLGQIELAGGGA